MKKITVFMIFIVREIRKLLETTCVENFFLLVKQGYVVGILFSDGIDNYLSFSGMGKWSLHINKKPALIASGNKCSLYKNIKSIDFKKEYACCFGLDEVPPNIYTIVEIATKQKHGTALVICDDADEEADRLCKLKRGMRIYPLVLEDEESFKYVESITAMDGALLLDPLGVCHAVSVILDGDAVIPGSTARGARYNSICNYVERQSRKKGVSSLGIIISEDGSVDLCAASGGNG